MTYTLTINFVENGAVIAAQETDQDAQTQSGAIYAVTDLDGFKKILLEFAKKTSTDYRRKYGKVNRPVERDEESSQPDIDGESEAS